MNTNREKLLLALVLALALLRGTIYATVLPPWDLNDEEQHFHYVQFEVENGRRPSLVETYLAPAILASAVQTARWEHFHMPRPKVLDVRQIGLEGRSYEAYQPPLYYLTLAIPYALAPEGILNKLYTLRFISVVLSSVSLVLAYLLFRRAFGQKGGLAIGATLLLALIPERTMAMSRVNNDVLAELLSTAFLFTALALATRGFTPKNSILLGIITGLAIQSKTSCLALVLPGLLAISVFGTRARTSRRMLTDCAAFLTVTAAISGPVFVDNFVSYGDPIGIAAFLRVAGFGPKYSSLETVMEITKHLWMTRWFAIVPDLFAGVMAIVGFLAAIGVGRRVWRDVKAERGICQLSTDFDWKRIVLFSVAAGVWLIPLLWGVRSGVIQYVDGRFVAPSLTPLMGLLVLGLYSLFKPGSGRLVIVALIGLFALVDAIYIFWYSLPYYYFQSGFEPAQFFAFKPALVNHATAGVVMAGYLAVLATLAFYFWKTWYPPQASNPLIMSWPGHAADRADRR